MQISELKILDVPFTVFQAHQLDSRSDHALEGMLRGAERQGKLRDQGFQLERKTNTVSLDRRKFMR